MPKILHYIIYKEREVSLHGLFFPLFIFRRKAGIIKYMNSWIFLVNHPTCKEETPCVITRHLIYGNSFTCAGMYELDFAGLRIGGYTDSHMTHIASAARAGEENQVSSPDVLAVYLGALCGLSARTGTEADAELLEYIA